MRELPVALSSGSSLDDLRISCKHTLGYTHPHEQAKTKTWRETKSICALIVFAQGSESTPESVDRHLQFSSSPSVILCAIIIRGVSGLVFSHKARKWNMTLSAPLLLDRRPDNRSAPMYASISSTPAPIQTLIHTRYAAQRFELPFTIYPTVDQLSHWVSCITVT